MAGGAAEVVAGVGGGRGGIHGAARGMRDLLGSWAGVPDGRRGAVERAQGNGMHSMGEGVRDASGSVPSEDAGPDGEEQLSTVLGESAVLRDGGRDGQAVSVAERSGTAGICSTADSKWDPGNGRARVYRDRRRGICWMAWKAAQEGDMGADI